jgi:hypothetical protein
MGSGQWAVIRGQWAVIRGQDFTFTSSAHELRPVGNLRWNKT